MHFRKLLLLSVVFALLLMLGTPAPAQEQLCKEYELAETLLQLDEVYNQRPKRLVRCAVVEETLSPAFIEASGLPFLLGEDLFARLVDGKVSNGELFRVSVSPGNLLQLTIEVQACAAHQGSTPDFRQRLGKYFFYSDIPVSFDQAARICNAERAWCSECE